MDQKIPIVFPLPFVLQSCTTETRKAFFRGSPDIEKRMLEWSFNQENEDKSWCTFQELGLLKKNFDYLHNSWECHLVCL